MNIIKGPGVDAFIQSIQAKYGYLRYINNWHKHPVISKMLCKIGRHDYEFLGNYSENYGELEFECFYCGHKKLQL